VSTDDRKQSRAAKLGGLAVAGVGLAHFTSPQLFDGITKQAFPATAVSTSTSTAASKRHSGLAFRLGRPDRWQSSG